MTPRSVEATGGMVGGPFQPTHGSPVWRGSCAIGFSLTLNGCVAGPLPFCPVVPGMLLAEDLPLFLLCMLRPLPLVSSFGSMNTATCLVWRILGCGSAAAASMSHVALDLFMLSWRKGRIGHRPHTTSANPVAVACAQTPLRTQFLTGTIRWGLSVSKQCGQQRDSHS